MLTEFASVYGVDSGRLDGLSPLDMNRFKVSYRVTMQDLTVMHVYLQLNEAQQLIVWQ